MPRFCARFKPPSVPQQLSAIGLKTGGLDDAGLYGRQSMSPSCAEALCCCLNPSGGDWEDIEPPQPHEWLEAQLEKTPDQSFRDFVATRPNRPDQARHTIYLQPLCEPGDLDGPAFPKGPWPSWEALVAAVTRFYAPLPVRCLPAVPMGQLRPAPSSRHNDYGAQYNAKQVLDALRVPSDAYCVLGVTMCDLFPRPEWNFVYGLARLTARVGVFSFARHTPERSEGTDEWRGAQLLHRSMKTMLHEIGHMFGLKHCTWFNCLMRGSNGEMVEHQQNYLHLCPVCLRKLHWNIGFDIPDNYANLLELYQVYEKDNESFARDCEFLRQRLQALEGLPPGVTVLPELRAWAGPKRSPPVATASARAVSVPAPAAEASRGDVRGRSPVAVPQRRNDAGSPAHKATAKAEPKCAPKATRRDVRPRSPIAAPRDAADDAERPLSQGSAVGRKGSAAQVAAVGTRGRAVHEATKRRGYSACGAGRAIVGMDAGM